MKNMEDRHMKTFYRMTIAPCLFLLIAFLSAGTVAATSSASEIYNCELASEPGIDENSLHYSIPIDLTYKFKDLSIGGLTSWNLNFRGGWCSSSMDPVPP